VAIVAIHQPEYLPWLGFFKKMMSSELFVFLDDAQFRKKGWQNRNRIRTKNGTALLSIPVHAHSYPNINEITIDNNKNWSNKHKKSILYNYARAPYFEEFKDFIESVFEKKFEYLIDLNTEIIKFAMNELEIKSKIVFSSELKISKKGSDRVLDICKQVGADCYITGTSWAQPHLKIEEFKKYTREEIFEQRKEKFLSIGKRKAFTIFSKESDWIAKDNFFVFVKEILFSSE